MNDIVLVCDAGGGTTDVNILQLKSARGEPTKLDQFGSVEGVSFQKRLKRTANRSQDDPLAQFLSTVGCIV